VTGARLRLEAPLPPELVEVLSRANLPGPAGRPLPRPPPPGAGQP
jgi:hypothetical protein